MNEILQKRVEEAAKKYCQDKNYILPDDTELSLEALTAIDAYIEAAKSILKNQWISVKEALPKFEGNFSDYYIIRTEDGWCDVTMYYRTSEKEYWWNFEKVKVTHWMEIPKLNSNE